MYEQSHRDYLRSWFICIIVCLSWAVNHYRDNAITYKAQRDKNARELKRRTRQLCADASAWCCCARCKIHEGVSDAKAENDALRDDVAADGSSVAHQKQSVSQCVKPPPPPAWIMQPPPDWQTPLNGIISPSEEADHYAKTTGKGTRSMIVDIADTSCPYRWATHAIVWAIHALPAEYKCLK